MIRTAYEYIISKMKGQAEPRPVDRYSNHISDSLYDEACFRNVLLPPKYTLLRFTA